MENLYTPDCIRTHSGIYMNVFNPTLEMIDINDIAHALSNQCRFAGHLKRFYSVAQHSWICHVLLKEKGISDELLVAALLHDASEAYLVDVPKPIKKRLPDYKAIEDKLMELIAIKFEFQYPLNPLIKDIDNQVLELEWESLMVKDDSSIPNWSNGYAKERFLAAYYISNMSILKSKD